MISVVICTYNRAPSLTVVLESLAGIRVPPGVEHEVLVVDNNSTDDTASVVERFRASHRLPVRCVHEARQGLSHARNTGVRTAAGEIIAFLDDDVFVHREWLAEVVRAFELHGADTVGGRVLLDPHLPKPAWWRPEYDGKIGLFDRGDAPRVTAGPADGMIGIGANLSFRRAVFDRHGVFRPELGRNGKSLLMGEEIDLIDRIRAAGGVAVYWPAAVVEHRPGPERLNKRYLRRWYRCYGQWSFVRDREVADDVVRIGNVPRWKYRRVIEDAWSALVATLTGRQAEAFRSQLGILAFLGYCGAAWGNAYRFTADT